MDEAALPKNPNQELAQWLFEASTPDCGKDAVEARKKLFAEIEAKNMAPFYQKVCETLKEPVNEELLAKYKAANTEELARLEKKITDALSENEIREALLAKAEYLCTIGDNVSVEAAFRATSEKTVALGQRMDLVFYQIRIGLFNGDTTVVLRNLEKAEDLLKQGGDWDRRNRLKVYRGLYSVVVRDFPKAASLFLETVSTFTSTELMEYKEFVGLTVLVAISTLSRPDLKKKVVDGPEIQEVLFEQPLIKQYLNSFYNCQYATFFQSLAEVEKLLKANRFFAPHYRYYVREMRILAYKQILESYRSLTLEHMSKEFGVSVAFMDKELSRFVAAGRLNCKIDKVGGIVETNRPDKKNAQYQSAIKQGDLLLNRIQKLSQVINI